MKNFDAGDRVVCIKDDEEHPGYLVVRKLYTVLKPFDGWDIHTDTTVPCIRLEEPVLPPDFMPPDWPSDVPVEPEFWGFESALFRLAFKPDPEVEKEEASDPIVISRTEKESVDLKG